MKGSTLRTDPPHFWDRTRWSDEDPIRRAARAAALPTGLLVILVGSLAGNLVIVGYGITLIRLVAMAEPRPGQRDQAPGLGLVGGSRHDEDIVAVRYGRD
jgi:hypothetical protein